MEVRVVNEVPPRRYSFVRGAETRKVEEILGRVEPSKVAAFFPDKTRPREEWLRELVFIRDRLKVAVKHVRGRWKIYRRDYVYYAHRLPEEEEEERGEYYAVE